MRTAVNDNSKSVALEEKFAMVSEQLCSVTERLDHAERDLDLERASREDIMNDPAPADICRGGYDKGRGEVHGPKNDFRGKGPVLQ